MSEQKRVENRKEMNRLSTVASDAKEKVLKKGNFVPISHDLFRYELKDLKDKYDGQTARDSIVLFLFLTSFVNGDSASETYMWAFPTIEQITIGTGIHKDRIKKLCDILESEGRLETKRVSWKGHVKKLYLPILP